MKTSTKQISKLQIKEILTTIRSRVAPSWPLKNMVAVNPYFGFSASSFDDTSRLFNNLSDIQMYMPLSFYQQKVNSGKILEQDIETALQKLKHPEKKPQQVLYDLHLAVNRNESIQKSSPKTITDLAEDQTGLNLNDVMIECISNWASLHFNEHDPSWKNHYPNSVFASWLDYARADKTLKIIGLNGFRNALQDLPDDYNQALELLTDYLKLDTENTENYLLKLCYRLPGWVSYLASIDWDNRLYQKNGNYLFEFITILLSWEYGLSKATNDPQNLHKQWIKQLQEKCFEVIDLQTDESFHLRSILQTALDCSYQRELILRFQKDTPENPETSIPYVQAVFCIDVRSEVYRRHLESASPNIKTHGYAGFFGFPLRYEQPGTNVKRNQCPVLLPSGPKVTEPLETCKTSLFTIRRSNFLKVKKIVNGLRKSPISSFGFVSPLGLFYLPKLIYSAFRDSNLLSSGKNGSQTHVSESNRTIDLTLISLDERVDMASNALKGMGITRNFAPIIAFIGHGSSGVNNPHKAGLACGACGGNSGDINALTAAKILNDKQVRSALSNRGIVIPEKTVFLAAMHDTATDHITLLNSSDITASTRKFYHHFLYMLNTASEKTRVERSIRFFQSDPSKAYQLLNRHLDWGQTRPEWGLAKCSCFIIAPRSKTKNIDLGGEAFLHDYHFNDDENLSILEGIMTAPMVVTSWINLQYYASTVDNKTFGAGNKTIHNVTAGIGVIEGSSGDLKIGLPLQSVHNGKSIEHQPYRLQVIIDASIEAINHVLKKNPDIQQLFDNQWIHLLQMNSNGQISGRYQENLQWEILNKI